MKHRRTWLALLPFVLALVAGWILRRRSTPPAPTYGGLLVPVDPAVLGRAVADPRHRLILVNAWASWCEPCRRELPRILALRRDWADRGLGLVLFSVDGPGEAPAAAAFLRDVGVDFPTFFKGEASLNLLSDINPRWSGAIPATLLFEPGRGLVNAWEGESAWNEIEKTVTTRLGAK